MDHPGQPSKLNANAPVFRPGQPSRLRADALVFHPAGRPVESDLGGHARGMSGGRPLNLLETGHFRPDTSSQQAQMIGAWSNAWQRWQTLEGQKETLRREREGYENQDRNLRYQREELNKQERRNGLNGQEKRLRLNITKDIEKLSIQKTDVRIKILKIEQKINPSPAKADRIERLEIMGGLRNKTIDRHTYIDNIIRRINGGREDPSHILNDLVAFNKDFQADRRISTMFYLRLADDAFRPADTDPTFEADSAKMLSSDLMLIGQRLQYAHNLLGVDASQIPPRIPDNEWNEHRRLKYPDIRLYPNYPNAPEHM